MSSNTPTTTAAECLSCGTTGGWMPPNCNRPVRTRGLCSLCYGRHERDGGLDQFPLVGGQGGWETFEGFPSGFVHGPSGWPEAAPFNAPLHPPLPASNRWGHVVWFTRPQHDPVGQRLFDAETRYVEIEAA